MRRAARSDILALLSVAEMCLEDAREEEWWRGISIAENAGSTGQAVPLFNRDYLRVSFRRSSDRRLACAHQEPAGTLQGCVSRFGAW